MFRWGADSNFELADSQIAGGMLETGGQNNTIQYNTFAGDINGIKTYQMSGSRQLDGNLIANNTFIGLVALPGLAETGYALDFQEGAASGLGQGTITVRNNVVADGVHVAGASSTGGGFVYMSGPVGNKVFSHNTVYNMPGITFNLGSDGGGNTNTVQDTLLIHNGYYSDTGGPLFDYVLYKLGGATLNVDHIDTWQNQNSLLTGGTLNLTNAYNGSVGVDPGFISTQVGVPGFLTITATSPVYRYTHDGLPALGALWQ